LPKVITLAKNSITYTNSTFDRIVPGMEDRHRDLALQRLGIVDAIPVPAEKFSMWALEDNFIAGPLTWDKVGAILTGEVEKFE
jgi:fructuronate reductase